jgi:murein DD-endopeptidase MepM/ murein hydrolase activator NlpD
MLRSPLQAAKRILSGTVLVALALLLSSAGASATPSGIALQFMARQPFVFPVIGPRQSSGFGMRVHPIRRYSKMHKGVDLAAPIGSFIRAIQSGIVVFADPYAGYGNLVVIKHANGLTSHYAHCDEIKIRTGQRVNAGEVIATIGSTGQSTGPHLHLEIRYNGAPLDPERIFPDLAAEAQG